MRLRIEDLALFGGSPAFEEPLHVGRPNIGESERFIERAREVLSSRRFTNDGPMVHEFETELARFLGVKHCVALCNATVALQVAARAAGMSGEVILPAFTFVATAHALDWIGIKPVFCDIDKESLTLDAARIEELVTPLTSGIVGVHLWGRPCDVLALQEIARRHGLSLLFDAAHALGCTYGGRRIGMYGNAEVFSFHATKVCNSFEGGAIATNDDNLAERCRLFRNFGFADYEEVVCPGTNGKMSEIAAAMGLTSLESWDRFVSINRRNLDCYRDECSDIPGLQLVPEIANEESNYQYVVLEVLDECAVDRDTLLAVLQAEGILARRYFWPGCQKAEPYRSRDQDTESRLPNTEALARRVLSLPTGTSIGRSEIRLIAEIARFTVERGREISAIRQRVTFPEFSLCAKRSDREEPQASRRRTSRFTSTSGRTSASRMPR